MDKDWDLYSNTNSLAIHSDNTEECDKERNFRRELKIIRESFSFNLRTPRNLEDSKDINNESVWIGRAKELNNTVTHLWIHLTESFSCKRRGGRELPNKRAYIVSWIWRVWNHLMFHRSWQYHLDFCEKRNS